MSSERSRTVWVVVGLVVLSPVAVLALVLAGHKVSSSAQAATINRSLDAAVRDLQGVTTVESRYPAEGDWFECCGGSGPSGDAFLRSVQPLQQAVLQVRSRLKAKGWELDDIGDSNWFVARRGEHQVTIDVLTIDSPVPGFAQGDTQVVVEGRT